MPENSAAELAIADFIAQPRVLPLTGVVQHYDWGGLTFIPDLLGEDNAAGQPYAELWMGANAGAPSMVDISGVSVPIPDLVAGAPSAVLGPDSDRFDNNLPYLFKVLDARKMLSIQAHPTKAQAEEGFARENAAGIDPKAPNRNYKDDNHKPEEHAVLTDFWMLHGFRPIEEIASVLSNVPELSGIVPDFADRLSAAPDETAKKALLRELYERVMTMPQTDTDAVLNPLVARLEREGPSDKDQPDFWALRAAETFPLPNGRRDRGIVSIYLLNLVHLQPGQGTYQPAGMLHAYLEGVTMELMANSDNVLRGGLTPKHVDVPELMRTLTFEYGRPEIIEGDQASESERIYNTPADEFVLSRLNIPDNATYQAKGTHGADILIVLEGTVLVNGAMRRRRGEAFLVPNGVDCSVAPVGGNAVLYKASVPRM